MQHLEQLEQRELTPLASVTAVKPTSRLTKALALSNALIILAALALNVFGQAVLKYGMTQMGPLYISADSLPWIVLQIITSPYVIGGLFIYALATFFWLVTLSRVDLSVAYPSLSLTQVFVLLIAWIVLREAISPLRILGVLVICLGMMLVARS